MSVCILLLFIQHAKRIGHIICPFVTWQAVPHYMAICDLTGCTTLSHKRIDFGKNKSTHYVLIFSTSWSETLQVHSAAHCHKCSAVFLKSLVILWVFNSSWIFYIDIRELHKNPKWWMAKLLEADLSFRTERHEETSIRFYKFCIRAWNVHTRNFIHNIHTSSPSDPSCTSNKKKFLFLLNKLTSKGAVRYLIIKYGKVCCVCSGCTDI